MKLKTKLIGGFLLVALITLIVGIIGLYGIAQIGGASRQVIDNTAPSLEYLLKIKLNLEIVVRSLRSMLNPNSSKDDRLRYLDNINSCRVEYLKAFEAYKKLPKTSEEERIFSEAQETIVKWRDANNSALELGKQIIETDILNPYTLDRDIQKFMKDHYAVFTKTLEFILTKKDFEGGVDHTACNFGKWLATFKSNNPIIKKTLEELLPNHLEFHKSVGEIKELIKQNNSAAALVKYKNVMSPSAGKTFENFNIIQQEIERALVIFNRMNEISLVDTRKYQNIAFPLFDKLIEMSQTSMKTSGDFTNSTITNSKNLSITFIIIGFIGALILGFILAISITQPVLSVVKTMQSVADGDLTTECGVTSKDELGLLGNNIESTQKKLNFLLNGVKNSAEKVKNTSISLEKKVALIASSSQQAAAGVEETSATMNEFSATIESIVNNVESQSAAIIHTNSSASQMAGNIKNVTGTLMEIKNSISQTSAAIEEMMKNISTITDNVNMVDLKAKESGSSAYSGKEAVLKTNSGMELIKTNMSNLVTIISGLGKSAENIGSIIEVISDISEQTNLLALNAAIEAARAGEHGKGFAVVADEVRKLAERSSKATKEISDIIKGIQSEAKTAVASTNEGAKLADNGFKLSLEAETALNGILHNFQEMSSLIKQVSISMNEQNKASEQIVRQVEKVNLATEQVANASNEQSKGVEEIVRAMSNVTMITEQIKNAMTEQRKGGQQINSAIMEISSGAKLNSQTAQDVAFEAEELKRISEQLSEGVSVFKLTAE